MRLTRDLEIGDATVQVRELTVAEIDAWWADAQREIAAAPEPDAGKIDVIAGRLCGEFTLADLRRVSTITPEQFRGATQSELAALMAAARELNPLFFQFRDEIGTLVGLALMQSATGGRPSPEPAVH
jgi:hypothetical protein